MQSRLVITILNHFYRQQEDLKYAGRIIPILIHLFRNHPNKDIKYSSYLDDIHTISDETKEALETLLSTKELEDAIKASKKIMLRVQTVSLTSVSSFFLEILSTGLLGTFK